jgi:hypothetical protein
MKPTYYEQGDVLHLRLSTAPAVRELSRGPVRVACGADGLPVELVVLGARSLGLFEPEVKLPLARAAPDWLTLMRERTCGHGERMRGPHRGATPLATTYFSAEDVLLLRLSRKAVVRELPQGHGVRIGLARDGSVVQVVAADAAALGLVPVTVVTSGDGPP